MAGQLPKLPGGVAFATFAALALGAALWPFIDGMIPAIGQALRGTGTRSTSSSVSV